MAAPLRVARALQAVTKRLGSVRNASANAYYVLLPEIPTDTAQNNEMLRMDSLPNFSAITASAAVNACSKLAIDFDINMEKHCKKLQESSRKWSFDEIFVPIEKAVFPLSYATNIARHLSLVKSKDFLEAYRRIHFQVETAKKEKFSDPVLYNAIKTLESSSSSLTSFQRALVRLYLLEGKLSGAELPDSKKEKLLAVLKKLSAEKNQFRYNVGKSGSLFKHTIVDPAHVAEIPPGILQFIAADKSNPARGPWQVTLHPAVFNAVLSYCSSREVRWNAWQAYNNRASTRHTSVLLNTNISIGTIRQQRHDAALMLGYSSYAELSMESKMAGTVENVLNVLEHLRQHFHPKALDELAQLQQYAASEGFADKLQPWDIYYYRRRQCAALYGKSQDFEDYFPFPVVLNGLFEMCQKLLGITVVKARGNPTNTWHPTVDVYEVHSEGSQLGYFFLDPYARLEQKLSVVWMDSCRGRSGLFDVLPLSTLSLSISPPLGKRPALMSPADITSLCYQFGNGLQQLLSRSPYSEIHGQRGLAQDTLGVCGKVLQGLAFRGDWLKKMSRHWESGQALSDTDVQSVISARKHMHAVDICEQLYISAYDMEMHSSNTHWNAAMKRLWPQYVPLPLSELDNHPCSMISIFGDDRQAASTYSHVWSDVVAANVLETLLGAGDGGIAAAGRKFRDMFMYEASALSATEACRNFCGHDPSPGTYLKMTESLVL